MSEFTTPFRANTLQEDRKKEEERFTIRCNEQYSKMLDKSAKILHQKKRSTIIKQLAVIGYNVIRDEKTRILIHTIFKNKRNNEIQGINDFND
jgi:hypothetical protein